MPKKAAPKKTEKKQTSKKSVSKRTDSPKRVQSHADVSPSQRKSFAPFASMNLRNLTRKQLFLIAGIIIFLVILYSLQGFFVVAKVNGLPISRVQLIGELEKQQGKQVLEQLVTRKLIEQEAAKEHVSISDTEVNNELKSVESQVAQSGQTLDQALAAQGITLQDLKDNIRLQLLAEKMATKHITVTDKEVTDYINKNKSSLPSDMPASEQRKQVKDTLLQQKKQTALQTWVQNLRSKANVDYLDKSLAPQG